MSRSSIAPIATGPLKGAVGTMDSPYDEPFGLEAGAGSAGGTPADPTAGEGMTVAIVLIAEFVIIAGLLLALWRRKRMKEQKPLREDLMLGHLQGPGVIRTYRGVIFVTIGMFAGCATQPARASLAG
jgi:hypothetical protein